MNKPSLNGSAKNSGNIVPEFNNTKDNFRHYLNIIRANILPVIIITLIFIILTVIYVFYAKDIYRSSATIKINRPQGSVLKVTKSGKTLQKTYSIHSR